MPIFSRLLLITACLAVLNPPDLMTAPSARSRAGADPFESDPEHARFFFDAALRRGLARDGLLLVVSVAAQRLYVIEREELRKAYPVSTSRRGMGNRKDSLRTPGGWHRIARRIGHGEPVGRVFTGRRPTGRPLSPSELRSDGDPDRVVSRILWLEGLEPGVNRGGEVDSFRRFIYIHGTNQEHKLGRPASKGCIRMANRDVIELFEMTETRPTWCLIHPAP